MLSGVDSLMPRTVLIIAYYFPPLGMGGVQRMAKLAKYLPEFGYTPIVLTVKPIRYPALDRTLLDELPEDVKIYRSGSFDPARISHLIKIPIPGGKLRSKIKQAGVAWPDSKIGWRDQAVKEARKIVQSHTVDLILSSSPPMTGHMVARDIHQESNIPWVADFRDIWETHSPEKLFDDPTLIEKSHGLLASICTDAHGLTCVNDSIGAMLPASARTILGGFDPDDFKTIDVSVDPNTFTLCYLGTISPVNPIEPFFKAARAACGKETELSERLRINLVGINNADAIDTMATTHGLQGKITCTGYLPHREALAAASATDVLLLGVPPDMPGIITGKIFDYLALPAPILASAPPDGEVQRLMKTYDGGICVAPEDDNSLVDALLSLFDNKRAGKTKAKGDISPLTRRNMARQFADLFTGILDG